MNVAQDNNNKQQVCVQLPTPADNVTLLAFAAERRPCNNRSIYMYPARRAHNNKPGRQKQCHGCNPCLLCGADRQTDGQTDARQFHRPCCAYYARSVNNSALRVARRQAHQSSYCFCATCALFSFSCDFLCFSLLKHESHRRLDGHLNPMVPSLVSPIGATDGADPRNNTQHISVVAHKTSVSS